MAEYKIEAQTREELGKYAQTLREQLLIPAVVYGGKENHNIKISKPVFEKLFVTAGESTIIDMVIDGKKGLPVVVKDFQRHPTTHEITHVDFYEVDMTKEIVASIPLVFIGEAPAVKMLGGSLSANINEVEIKCLPANLIHEIKVDLSILDELEKGIHVKELELPQNVSIVTGGDVLVVKVIEQKASTDDQVIAEENAVADVKVAGEEKKVEEETK